TPHTPAFMAMSRRMACGTPSPRTCSITARTCASCRCYWAMPICPPPRSTPMWRVPAWRSCMRSTTRAADNRSAFQRLQLAGDILPFLGIRGWILDGGDDRPVLRQLGIELQKLLLIGGLLVLRHDGINGAFRLTQ